MHFYYNILYFIILLSQVNINIIDTQITTTNCMDINTNHNFSNNNFLLHENK